MPPFTRAILLVNVIFFLLQQNFYQPMMIWFALWPQPGDLLGALPWHAPWQIVSYSLLHGDFFHLLFNMFAIWMFGSRVEAVWGPRRLGLAYLIAVISGAIAQVVVGNILYSNGVPIIGASAGVFGILLAYALVFPRDRIMLLIPPIPLPAPVFVGIYALLELYFGLTGSGQGVAHFAHLGGLLGGWVGYRHLRR
ncbi:MAG: rhomboid family intramembrane serine protease [Lautropia sp.]|nr:rhomboid family intramembrane serine protease [Lautropia sp.]